MYSISTIPGDEVVPDRLELIMDVDGSRVNPFDFDVTRPGAFAEFLDIWTVLIDDTIGRTGRVSVERHTLARMYATFLRERNGQDRARANHAADIKRIGERLMAEARSRDWCVEYDKVIAELNADLSVELPERARPFRVSIVVHVDAVSRDDADDLGRSLAQRLNTERAAFRAFVDDVRDPVS